MLMSKIFFRLAVITRQLLVCVSFIDNYLNYLTPIEIDMPVCF